MTVEVFEGPPAAEDKFTWFDNVVVSSQGTFIVHDPDDDVRLVVRTDHRGEVHLRIVRRRVASDIRSAQLLVLAGGGRAAGDRTSPREEGRDRAQR